MEVQATFPYFGQVNPLRIAHRLSRKPLRTRSFEVFVQSTILNQADIGNELVRHAGDVYSSRFCPLKLFTCRKTAILCRFKAVSTVSRLLLGAPMACPDGTEPRALWQAACEALACRPRVFVAAGSHPEAPRKRRREPERLVTLHFPGHLADFHVDSRGFGAFSD